MKNGNNHWHGEVSNTTNSTRRRPVNHMLELQKDLTFHYHLSRHFIVHLHLSSTIFIMNIYISIYGISVCPSTSWQIAARSRCTDWFNVRKRCHKSAIYSTMYNRCTRVVDGHDIVRRRQRCKAGGTIADDRRRSTTADGPAGSTAHGTAARHHRVRT